MDDRTISLKVALDALRTCYDTNLIVLDNGDELINYGDAVGAIEALPSAQPSATDTNVPTKQPGWIPCKTKLPEKDGSYLVTANNGQIAIFLFVKGMSENYWKQWGATAWMPLPAPWEGGQDESDD